MVHWAFVGGATAFRNKSKMTGGGHTEFCTIYVLDENICIKFGKKMQNDHTEMPT